MAISYGIVIYFRARNSNRMCRWFNGDITKWRRSNNARLFNKPRKNLYYELEWLQFAMDSDETNFEISKILYSGHVDSKRTD